MTLLNNTSGCDCTDEISKIDMLKKISFSKLSIDDDLMLNDDNT